MITVHRIAELINLAKKQNIFKMQLFTGQGLIREAKNGQVHMGMLGHNPAMSQEAIEKTYWGKYDPAIVSHFHKGIEYLEKSPPHDCFIQHNEQQHQTIRPLKLVITRFYNDRCIAEISQGLNPPILSAKKTIQKTPGFHYDFSGRNIVVSFPVFTNSKKSDYIPDNMSDLYKLIWKECLRVYYLYCEDDQVI